MARAEEFIRGKISPNFYCSICDATPDSVVVLYDDGEILFGDFIEFTYQSDEIERFYDYLSEELLIENLLWFDD